ncbi:MAG: EmrB/QacA subfamily drug resistance transporter [Rhodospirillales bacterium]|nr:EmrB/QacA subfamily drug resistance transporter [Rhodospirillales bacterium]
MPDSPSTDRQLSSEALFHRRLVTTACMFAMFMASVEGTIVATAMPTIVADLGGFRLFSWVFAAYLLSQAVSTPIYGRLSDVFGRKPIFFAGATLFLVSSLACGFAWGMVPLIVFRVLQGLGAGAVQPIGTTIVGDIYGPADRARMQGWLSSIWGISAVIGPLLGGFIVEHLHWSLIFLINLPIGIAAMVLLAVYFHERVESRRHTVDYFGALLLMIGLGAVMLIAGQFETLDQTVIIVVGGVGLLALAALVLQERRAAEPILSAQLWRNRVLAIGNGGALIIGALVMGVVAFLPTYVQGVMGRSATAAGFVIATQSVGWSVAGVLAAGVMVRRSYRAAGAIGGVLLLIGAAILIAMDPGRGPLWAGAGASMIGLGMGFAATTFLVSVQGSVGWGERGMATSTNLFLRTVGMSLGAGICGAIVNLGVFREVPEAGDIVSRLLLPGTRESLGPQEIARLTDAIAGSLHVVYLIIAAMALAVLLLSLALPAGQSPTRPARQG